MVGQSDWTTTITTKTIVAVKTTAKENNKRTNMDN